MIPCTIGVALQSAISPGGGMRQCFFCWACVLLFLLFKQALYSPLAEKDWVLYTAIAVALVLTISPKLIPPLRISATQVLWIKLRDSIDTQRASQITTTFSVPVQTAGLEAMAQYGYYGAAAVMNYETGDLIACITYPIFDPRQGSPDLSEYDGSANKNDTVYTNLVLDSFFIPGSIQKITTSAAAIDNIKSLSKKRFDCDGRWDSGVGIISCGDSTVTSHGHNMTLSEAFAKSCNITFGSLAMEMGDASLREIMLSLGWTKQLTLEGQRIQRSRIEWDAERKEESETPKSGRDLGMMGIGQSTLQANPMHMLMISATIANDGVMVQPYFIKEMVQEKRGEQKAFYSARKAKTERWLSTSVAKDVAALMKGVTQSGSGINAALTNYTVCGKTGTALQGSGQPYNCWFTGFIKEKDAPYAVVVMVQSYSGGGGTVAGPIAKKLLEVTIQTCGLTPDF